jgi:hypothetical protein
LLEVSNTVVQDTGGDGIATSSDTSSIHLHHNRINSTGHISLWQPAGKRRICQACDLRWLHYPTLLAGIRARGQNILVEHNDVGYNPYGGILVGWQQGTVTPARGEPIDPSLVVQYNRVHNYGLGILSDFGGIYLSSNDNTCFNVSTCYLPSLIFNNIVMHGRHYNYGSQGIYMDEQVCNWHSTVKTHVAFDCLNCAVAFDGSSAEMVDSQVYLLACRSLAKTSPTTCFMTLARRVSTGTVEETTTPPTICCCSPDVKIRKLSAGVMTTSSL